MMSTQPDATPKPERSLNHQAVLEEDEYTAALSHIIARDFFPNLVHLDATNEYLDALSSRDPHLIGASVRRLEEINNTPMPGASRRGRMPLQTPGQTPYAFGASDTPLRPARLDGEPAVKRPKYDSSLSLDNFQARYTSEDNSSFTEILDEENRQRKEKWAWAWDAQKRVEQKKLIAGLRRERMLIEPPPGSNPGVIERFVIEPAKPVGLITAGINKEEETDEESKENGEENKELVLSKANQDEEGDRDVMAPKKDNRIAGVDGWNFKARNSLMFPPDADSSPYHSKPKTSATVPSGEEKSIAYGSTRLPEQEESTDINRPLSEPPSPTRSRIVAAISGTPYHPRDPSSSSTFSLVPSLPSPTPEQLGPAAVKQLMTWGTLTATPRLISSNDDLALDVPTPSTPFHIPAPSSREALSHKLSNKASKSLRAKAELLGLGGATPGLRSSLQSSRASLTKGSMGPPSWTPASRRSSHTAGNLTPAAKRLLDRTMGTSGQRRAEAMEKNAGWSSAGERDMNRVRWTPTPGKGR
ncbi:nuclear protein DGCR14 [Lentinula aciculospora]|uniref:Nuclear protein DGCR14 n=1 Tax=Lentinula aciculospora TaxID=153920 RepID=A0A9W9DTQ0_9AGAR|nr:nuclear protein DGCR14 [Lentinula aciculospora]